MWDINTTVQEVEITRAEYIALKQHLAELRRISLHEEVQNAA
jgi:hypothetical protein